MSRWYFDTSAALKLILEEQESAALAAVIDDEAPDVVVTYDQRMAEAATALGMSVSAPV